MNGEQKPISVTVDPTRDLIFTQFGDLRMVKVKASVSPS